MRALLIASMLMLTSCAGFQAYRGNRDVDPMLERYVQNFERAYGVVADLTVDVRDLSGEAAEEGYMVIGVCYGDGRVYIDQFWVEYWDAHYPMALEEVVLHELGHCVFNLDHDEKIITSVGRMQWCPVSVMFPYTFEESGCFADNREYYYRELGGRVGLPLLELPPEPEILPQTSSKMFRLNNMMTNGRMKAL